MWCVTCRESSSSIKLFKNFKESTAIKTSFAAEALCGGSLLGVRGSDFVCFYDWGSGKVIAAGCMYVYLVMYAV